MKKALVGVIVAILFCSTFAILIAPCAGAGVPASQASIDWWTMFHHDSSHSGYTTSAGPVSNKILWNYPTGGVVESSLAAANGYVYVPSTDGNLYCLNATSGALVWSYTAGGYVWGPAVYNGYVYISSKDHNVYCLNATSGALAWKYTTGGSVYPPTVANGDVYVCSADDNVYCLDATSGTLVWIYTTGYYPVESCPAIANGYVYFGSTDDNVYCLNAQTGTKVWSFPTGSYVSSPPAVSGGYVYVGSDDHYVYCLNAQTGTEVWSFSTNSLVFASPAVANGYVYVGSEDHNVYCLNAQTGAKVWSFSTGGIVLCSPAVSSNGYVYIGSTDGNFFCLNAQTGSNVWSYSTHSIVSSSPALANGVLYAGSSNGIVYAFGAEVAPSNSSSQSTEVWVPAPSNAAAATIVAAAATGAAALVFTFFSDPLGGFGGKIGERLGSALPDNFKSWLEDFVASRRKLKVEEKTGSPLKPTKTEILAYLMLIIMLTLSFSYVKASSLADLIAILPVYFATAILVGLVKKVFSIAFFRSRGIWTEHVIWPFGLGLFVVTTLAFRVPFSSPTRNVACPPKETEESSTTKSLDSSQAHHVRSPKFHKRVEAIASAGEILITLSFAGFFAVLMLMGFIAVGSAGLAMCLISAFFDTFPIPPMSGRGIYDHNKKLWVSLFVVTLLLYALWVMLL